MEPEAQPYRLFLALAAPGNVKAALKQAQDQLRRELAEENIRWVPTVQLHLTLRFFGRVEAAQVPELTGVLEDTVRAFGPLDLAARALGCFPNARRPRVLWAGIEASTDKLAALWAAIQKSTASFGEPPDRDHFAAHITLGRVKFLSPPGAGRLAESLRRNASTLFGTWQATELDLMRSHLSSSGAKHEVLAKLKLPA